MIWIGMRKINCRNKKICILCKHLLGDNPQVNYHTGECRLYTVVGKCALDETGEYHKADSLCSQFEKSIIYM